MDTEYDSSKLVKVILKHNYPFTPLNLEGEDALFLVPRIELVADFKSTIYPFITKHYTQMVNKHIHYIQTNIEDLDAQKKHFTYFYRLYIKHPKSIHSNELRDFEYYSNYTRPFDGSLEDNINYFNDTYGDVEPEIQAYSLDTLIDTYRSLLISTLCEIPFKPFEQEYPNDRNSTVLLSEITNMQPFGWTSDHYDSLRSC